MRGAKVLALRRGRGYLLALFALSLLLLGFVATRLSIGESVAQSPTKKELMDRIYKLSMPFIENRGQLDEEVAYYSKTFGGTLFITKDGELVYSLPKYEKKEERAEIVGGVVLKEKLIGGKVREVKGEEPSDAKVSYFIGNDPSKWISGLKTYGVVSLGEVYEGIELKLRAYGKNVEKLFYVKPGARVENIALAVEGAKSLKVDEKSGELVVETELGEVRFTKPVAYYLEEPNKKIEVAYSVKENTYTFAIFEYDRTKTIVIDPLLASTFIGGSNLDVVRSIALDSAGNVYVTGRTYSSNYPTTPGAYDTSFNGGWEDVFVSKLSGDLTQLLASTFIGGGDYDEAYSIAFDSAGNVYVTGGTSSSDYPTTSGAYDTSFNSSASYYSDVFVSKLSGDLTQLLASTFIGGVIGIEPVLSLLTVRAMCMWLV